MSKSDKSTIGGWRGIAAGDIAHAAVVWEGRRMLCESGETGWQCSFDFKLSDKEPPEYDYMVVRVYPGACCVTVAEI